MVTRDKGRLYLFKGKFKNEMPAGCSRLGARNSGVSK